MATYDVSDPFRTFFREHPDFNRSDSRAEALQLQERELLIEQFLKGEIALDDTLDCLSQQGIDPDEWIEVTVDNINYVVDNGIRFVSNDKGILVPDSYF